VDGHRVADGGALQRNSAVVASHRGAQRSNGLIAADVDDLNPAGDRVAWTHRSSEVPIDIEKYRAWPWQLLRDHRIEDGAGNAALNDNLPKPGRPSGLRS